MILASSERGQPRRRAQPAAGAQEASWRTGRENLPKPHRATRPRGAGGVLIVDDEPINRLVLHAMLEEHGLRVAEAASGEDALQMLAAERFDLILLDVRMPGIDGIEVLARLRRETGPSQDAPVVAVTGDTSRTVEEYRSLGFARVIAKPISFAAVEAAVRSHPRPAEPRSFR